MNRAIAFAAATILAGCTMPPPRPPAADSGWEIVVLGIAQDAGMPHLGCNRPPCSDAREGRRRAEKVSCLGLVNRSLHAAYLFDATPDLPAQVHALTGGRMPDAIFLTHAHIGHYTGLMYLGKEAVAARGVPVYGSSRMAEFLTRDGPWSRLVADGNIELRTVEYDRAVELPGGLRVTPFRVPHREEYTDAVGFLIETPAAKAVFIPDIDQWQRWDRDVRALVDGVDYAFLDGTFSSAAELPGRDIAQIPHPMMSATRGLLRGVHARVMFIHLNHSNPEMVGGAPDVAREGMRFPM